MKQYEEFKTDTDWAEFYTEPRFTITTMNKIFDIYIDMQYGTNSSAINTNSKIISKSEFDAVAMEIIVKQKLKMLLCFGEEKEKLFVTKMVKNYLKNKEFSNDELKKIDKIYTEFISKPDKTL